MTVEGAGLVDDAAAPWPSMLRRRRRIRRHVLLDVDDGQPYQLRCDSGLMWPACHAKRELYEVAGISE